MNNKKFEYVKCNLCGSDNYSVIYPSQRTPQNIIKTRIFKSSSTDILKDPLVKCNICGLQYVNPRINAHLALKSYTDLPDRIFISQSIGREKTFRRSLKIIQKIWRKLPGKILDIGTGNGSFLKIAKDAGWQVSGCEPNHWLVQWCKKIYQIEVNQGTIFDLPYKNESFGVITLWDVIEHTPDPSSVMKKSMHLLKPGGLLIINFPDIGSWIAKLMGRKWVFLVSAHYFYFNKKTINKLIENNSLEIVKMKPHYQTLGLNYILKRAVPYLGYIGKILYKICKFTGLSKYQVTYWMGQTLVIARKK